MTGIKYGSIPGKEDVKTPPHVDPSDRNAGFVAVPINDEAETTPRAEATKPGAKAVAPTVKKAKKWSRLEVAIFKTERYSCLPLLCIAVTFVQLYLFFDYQIRTGGEGPVRDHEVKVRAKKR